MAPSEEERPRRRNRRLPKKKAAPKQTKAAAKPGSRRRRKPLPSSKAKRAHVQRQAQESLLGEITVPVGHARASSTLGCRLSAARGARARDRRRRSCPRIARCPSSATRVGKGRFADCWDHVAVKLAAGEVTHSKKLGEAGVDFARLVCMDHGRSITGSTRTASTAKPTSCSGAATTGRSRKAIARDSARAKATAGRT